MSLRHETKPAPRRLLPACVLLNCVAAIVAASTASPAEDVFAAARERMVREQIERRDVTNQAVLAAMRRVPRHEFVGGELRDQAYHDNPLPIGHGQTISQPYIVALMTELLQVKPGDKVLEIGTGSGYQAAVLGEITTNVFTLEIVAPLAIAASNRLQRPGLQAIRARQGDGYFGWKEQAPFDGIIVTAAADHIPPPLLQQLKPGGRMVIPIGPVHATQRLVVVTKQEDGKVRTENVLPVRFVPLTGGPRDRGK